MLFIHRKAFTMIELIFVIVIIGILAMVAIPKLASTSTDAKKALVNSFIGALNRTVGPTMYSAALAKNYSNGDITSTGADICRNANNHTSFPEGISMNEDCEVTVDATKLPSPSDIKFIAGTGTESPAWKLVW